LSLSMDILTAAEFDAMTGGELDVMGVETVDNIWSSAASTDGNADANWSLGHVPTAGETARFDATSTVNCTYSAALTCDGISWYSGYTGTMAFGTHAHALTTGLTFRGTGDHVAVTTGKTPNVIVNKSSGYVAASGWDTDGKTIDVVAGIFNANSQSAQLWLDSITIRAGATMQSGESGSHLVRGYIDNYGTIECQHSGAIQSYYGNTYNRAGGLITGTGTGWFEQYGGTFALQAGEVNVPEFDTRNAGQLVAGTYNSAKVRIRAGAANESRILSGAYVFSGNLVIDIEAAGNLTIDMATNAATLTVAGNLTFTHTGNGNAIVTLAGKASSLTIGGNVSRTGAGTGTDTWTKGTAETEVTFNGTGSQSVAFPCTGQGPVKINKPSGTLTLAAALNCQSLTVAAGTIDPNGQTITTAGDCTLTGGNFVDAADTMDGSIWNVGGNVRWATSGRLKLRGSSAWELNATGVARVVRPEVSHCDASGGVEVLGVNGVDGGDNTHWKFARGGSMCLTGVG
jgi:hypothetical protein